MAAHPTLQLQGVTRRFGSATAADAVDLDVAPGEFVTLLGPSGCGKTTLLNLVAGFLEPDAGRILIDGRDVTLAPPHRRDIGLVFQSYALFPHMSVVQNVAFGLRMRGIARRETVDRVQAALATVRLEGLADRRPRELSGGQQQRVALGRALVINPKLLLLDEPLSALDKNLRRDMQVELKEIQRRIGITTVFVTHDQSEALSLSDRVAVMRAGRIEQLGAPHVVYRRPATPFVASFIGDINRLAGQLAGIDGDGATVRLDGGGALVVPAAKAAGLGQGQPVWLYLRPEALRLAGPAERALGRGPVRSVIYQGTHRELRVETGAGLLHLRLNDAAGAGAPDEGVEVGVQVDPGEALLFPRAPEGGGG